jgi:hypothetical protein
MASWTIKSQTNESDLALKIVEDQREPRLVGDERSLAEFGPHLRQLSLVIGELPVRFEERV